MNDYMLKKIQQRCPVSVTNVKVINVLNRNLKAYYDIFYCQHLNRLDFPKRNVWISAAGFTDRTSGA